MSHTPLNVQPVGSPSRLEALEESGLLDSLEEESYDRFTRLARSMLEAEISLITLVAENRQFFKSQNGLGEPLRSLRQNPISYSFCRFVVEEGGPVIIEDATADQRVKKNPAVTELGVRSYLGMPISTPDGFILGSLCAVGTAPRKWSAADLTTLSDLADAVNREIELSEQSTALRQAIHLSEEGRKKMEEHVRRIIHDLRSPAAAASSCLQMLAKTSTDLSSDDRELIEIGTDSAREVISMTNLVLEAERAAGLHGNQLALEPLAVSLLIRRAVRIIHPFAREIGLRLESKPPEAPLFLRVDGDLIHRVLVNFLTNAVKFSPEGGIITIQANRCFLDGVSMCRLAVKDHGPGVKDEEKAVIFHPFVTGSQVGRRDTTSFGIGLSFCQSAVEAHGGTIGVEDSPEGGSIFYCMLPEWA